jgi:hypothetical protein
MFAASKTDGSSELPDPQFNYVTMLLHGDGTNGAQNNTFLDSSASALTITRNSNTTQGSFSPYGSNWSNYVNGTSDYLSNAGTGTTYDLTGDFCVEGFFNFTSLTDVGVWGIQPANGQAGLRLTTESNLTAVLISGNATAHSIITSSVAPIIGQWNHIAVTRSGSALTLWLNGVSVGTGSSASWTGSNLPISIGRSLNYSNATPYYMNGYISNFRVVKGSPVYTSAFTPPTTPLTAITNTQLLTCQSNRYIDNSTNNFAITVNGTPSVQRFNPFGTSTAYSTSVIGGSGYFDGTLDFLTSSSSANLALGSGDWSVQFWVNFTGTPAVPDNQTVIELTSMRLIVGRKDDKKVRVYLNSDKSGASLGPTLNNNEWNFISVSRTGTTVNVFVNNTSVYSFTDSSNFSTSTLASIGRNNDAAEIMTGYVSDVRVLKGTYNVTVPTAPLTAITNTSLLLNFTNGAIFDNAMMNDLETVGNAQISTSVKKFGTGSLAFDGTGDWLYSPTTTQFNPRQPFTVEFWTYPISYASDIAWINGNGNFFYIETYSGTIYVGDGSNNIISGSPPTVNVWTHVALSFDGTTYRLFYNGTSQATSTTLLQNNTLTAWYVGAKYDGSRPFNGYIDDLRITKGYARYTANFTAPTTAFPNTGPV